jgi:hypothetical protein
MSTKQSAASTRSRFGLAAAIVVGLGLVIGIASWWPFSSKKPHAVVNDSRKASEDLTRQKLKMTYEQQRGQRTLAQRVTDPVVGPIIDAGLAKANAVRATSRAELQTNITSVQPRPGEIIVHIRGGRSADEDQVIIDSASALSMPEMTRTVADWLQQNPGRPCLIRTDRAAHYETLVKVRDSLEAAGIRAGIGLDQNLFFRIPLQELGIDLAAAPSTTRVGELPDLFEEDPPGSHGYRTRKEAVVFSLGFDECWFVPAKSIFYIQSDPLASSTRTYYGPFPGDLKMLMDKLRTWHPTVAMAQGWVDYSTRILESVKKRHDEGSSTDAQLALAEATLQQALQQAQAELARAVERTAPPAPGK